MLDVGDLSRKLDIAAILYIATKNFSNVDSWPLSANVRRPLRAGAAGRPHATASNSTATTLDTRVLYQR